MSDDDNQEMKLKLTFAPEFFDHFDGTQEELDELVAIIKSKFEDGTLVQDGEAFGKFLLQNPEIVTFVEGLTDEEVTDMLAAMDAFAAYPEINHTLH